MTDPTIETTHASQFAGTELADWYAPEGLADCAPFERVEHVARPALRQDGREVLRRLGYGPVMLARLIRSGSPVTAAEVDSYRVAAGRAGVAWSTVTIIE